MLQRIRAELRPQSRRRGQSMVEASMVFLSAAVLLSGMFDLGRAFYYNIAVANAVREGGRLAVDATRTNSEIQQAVSDAAPSIALTNITVEPSSRTISNSGETVRVTATHNFTVLTPVISSILGTSFPITRSAQFMMF
jgi:Flp pilus assembly protein TadG